MQVDQLVISVDAENNGNPADVTYDRYIENENRSVYITSAHVPEARDTLGLYRTFPTKSGNFKGVSKSALKFTRDIEVSGVDSSTVLTSPMIADISFSIPVGALAIDILELRQRMIAALDNDSFMDSLNIQLMV